MSDAFQNLRAQCCTWFDELAAAGWLSAEERAQFDALEGRTPDDLFETPAARPLVVALFGGTGVGKSSLLNRLAEEPIARVGVERPTSHEVTIYVHDAVKLAKLPPELPLTGLTVHRHHRDAWRDVLWVDAPDIDSTVAENRQQALAWLPHVDLVVYVVSPERYRDDVGWRDLLAREHRHGWLFVVNRWDEGVQTQVDDFAKLLREAGFNSPVVLRTSCAKQEVAGDDFPQLESTLTELLAAHGVRELARLGLRARLAALRETVQAAQAELGTAAAWDTLVAEATPRWEATAANVQTGLAWSVQVLAGQLAAEPNTWLQQAQRALRGRAPQRSEPADENPVDRLVERAARLWDDWAEQKVVGWCDETELLARRAHLPAAALREGLEPAIAHSTGQVQGRIADTLRATFALPGNALTRWARRATGFLMAFLPTVALLWVAWTIVTQYIRASRGLGPYLNVGVAVHSALFVLITWAVPFVLDRLLKPSAERMAQTGLTRGLADGLDEVGESLQADLRARAAEATAARVRGATLAREIDGLLATPAQSEAPVIQRVVSAVGVGTAR